MCAVTHASGIPPRPKSAPAPLQKNNKKIFVSPEACRWARRNWLSVALIAATLLRMALACLPAPVFGYANNLDFFRQSACVGVWEDYQDRPRIAADLDGPMARLIYDGKRLPIYCMRSSDNLFAWAASRFHHKHDAMDLREIGALKLLFITGSIITVVLLPIGRVARLIVSALFLFAFGDLAVLGYINTLYVDASGLIATTICAGLVVALTGLRKPPSLPLCVFCAVQLIWLGMAKTQFAPLAALFGILIALPVWINTRRAARAASLAVAGACAPLLFLALNAAPGNIMRDVNRINKRDTVLGAVLPASADPLRGLARLGLPPRCATVIGHDSYTIRPNHQSDCPEVVALSPLRLLPLFLADPGTFTTPMAHALRSSRTTLDIFPHFERPADAARAQFRLLRVTSLSALSRALSPALYGVGVVTLIAAGIAALPLWLWAMWRRQPRELASAAACCAVGAMITVYGLASAVFGDGYIELPRHTAPVMIGLACSLSGLACLALQAARRGRHAAADPAA